jgi:hypothetical protein
MSHILTLLRLLVVKNHLRVVNSTPLVQAEPRDRPIFRLSPPACFPSDAPRRTMHLPTPASRHWRIEGCPLSGYPSPVPTENRVLPAKHTKYELGLSIMNIVIFTINGIGKYFDIQSQPTAATTSEPKHSDVLLPEQNSTAIMTTAVLAPAFEPSGSSYELPESSVNNTRSGNPLKQGSKARSMQMQRCSFVDFLEIILRKIHKKT